MGYFTLISGYASFSKCIRTLTHIHGDHLLGKAAHCEQRCNRGRSHLLQPTISLALEKKKDSQWKEMCCTYRMIRARLRWRNSGERIFIPLIKSLFNLDGIYVILNIYNSASIYQWLRWIAILPFLLFFSTGLFLGSRKLSRSSDYSRA